MIILRNLTTHSYNVMKTMLKTKQKIYKAEIASVKNKSKKNWAVVAIF